MVWRYVVEVWCGGGGCDVMKDERSGVSRFGLPVIIYISPNKEEAGRGKLPCWSLQHSLSLNPPQPFTCVTLSLHHMTFLILNTPLQLIIARLSVWFSDDTRFRVCCLGNPSYRSSMQGHIDTHTVTYIIHACHTHTTHACNSVIFKYTTDLSL